MSKRDFSADDFLEFISKKNLIRENLDVEFLFEEISQTLTRRQTVIIRLLLLEKHSQARIGEMLGFSPSTVSLELKKIRTKIVKALRDKEK